MLLAISTDSFHYKYYQLLRRIWNFSEKRDRVNLCTYTQFLFWFSIWTVLCSPAILGGWLLLKGGRFLYKVCSWTATGRKLLDMLDNIGLGKKIDTLSDRMVERPAATLAITFLGFFAFVLTQLVFVVGIIGGIVYIKAILMFVAALFICLGLVVFYICLAIGHCLVNAIVAVLFTLKWLGILLAGYAVFIVVSLGLVAVMLLIGMIAVRIVNASEKLSGFFGFKLNGYQAARIANTKRREELARLRAAENTRLLLARKELQRRKAAKEIPYEFWEKIEIAIGGFFTFIGRKIGEFLVGRGRNIKGGSWKMVSGFGVFWLTLISMKQGICPLVEFMDEEEEEESSDA